MPLISPPQTPSALQVFKTISSPGNAVLKIELKFPSHLANRLKGRESVAGGTVVRYWEECHAGWPAAQVQGSRADPSLPPDPLLNFVNVLFAKGPSLVPWLAR